MLQDCSYTRVSDGMRLNFWRDVGASQEPTPTSCKREEDQRMGIRRFCYAPLGSRLSLEADRTNGSVIGKFGDYEGYQPITNWILSFRPTVSAARGGDAESPLGAWSLLVLYSLPRCAKTSTLPQTLKDSMPNDM